MLLKVCHFIQSNLHKEVSEGYKKASKQIKMAVLREKVSILVFIN